MLLFLRHILGSVSGFSRFIRKVVQVHTLNPPSPKDSIL
jgi:hypothetical protein